jgi:hypothetical protein
VAEERQVDHGLVERRHSRRREGARKTRHSRMNLMDAELGTGDHRRLPAASTCCERRRSTVGNRTRKGERGIQGPGELHGYQGGDGEVDDAGDGWRSPGSKKLSPDSEKR